MLHQRKQCPKLTDYIFDFGNPEDIEELENRYYRACEPVAMVVWMKTPTGVRKTTVGSGNFDENGRFA